MATSPKYTGTGSNNPEWNGSLRIVSVPVGRVCRMEGLATLGPFVRLCQLSGFFPFRMELDAETGRFLGLRQFSWRHPLTWWFLTVKLVTLSFVVPWVGMVRSLLSKTDQEMLLKACLCCQEIFAMVVSVMIFLTPLGFSRLGRAVDLIRKADDCLLSVPEAVRGGDTVILRTCTGFLATLGAIGYFVWFVLHDDILPLYCIPVLVLTTLHTGCWLLLIHLSYYVLAHRIRLLSSYLWRGVGPSSGCNRNYAWHSSDDSTGGDVLQKLRTVQSVFDVLCQSAGELNAFNSVTVFVIFTTKTLSFISTLYICCISVFVEEQKHLMQNVLKLILFDLIYFAVVFNAADSPVDEVVRLRQQVMNIPRRMFHSGEDHLKEMSCAMAIREERVRLVAGGMFNIGIHLTPAVIGTVIAYMVSILPG